MSKKQPTPVAGRKKRWPKILAAVALLITIFLVSLPFAVRYSLERWLLKHGAQSADIEKIHINLFTGKAGIHGLRVKLADNIVLADDTISLDVSLRSLYRKVGHIETGIISGLIIDIDKQADNTLRVGSITTTPSPDTSETTEKSSWLFQADDIEIENCDIHYSLPDLKHTIHIDHAELHNFFTGTSIQPGSLTLVGTVNKTPINLQLDTIELKPSLRLGGHVKIDGYTLDTLQDLLKDSLRPFAGLVGLNGDVTFTLSDKGDIGTLFDGDITVSKGDIGNAAFTTNSPLLSYNGTVNYAQSKSSGIQIDLSGLLQGDDFALTVAEANLDLLEKKIELRGKTSVSLTDAISVATDGSLDFAGLNLALPPSDISHSGFHWTGEVLYQLVKASQKTTINTDGSIQLSKPSYGASDKGFALQTQADDITWKGKIDVDLGGTNGQSGIAVNGLLQGSNYNLVIPESLDFTEQKININGTTYITLGTDLAVHYKGSQQHDNIQVSAAQTTNKATMSWQGQFDYQKKGNNSELTLNGALKGIDLSSQLEAQKITLKQQQVDFTPKKLKVLIGKKITIGGKAELVGKNFEITDDQRTLLLLENFDVKGLSGKREGGAQVKTFTLNHLKMPPTSKQPISIQIPAITLEDISSNTFTDATIGSITVQQPIIRDTKTKTLLAGLDEIAVHTLTFTNPLKITASSISTGKGVFFKKEKKGTQPLGTLRRVKAKNLSWSSKNGAFCNTIAVDSLQGNFIRKDGTEETNPKAVKKKKTPESPPPAVRINTIAFTGESGFTFDDQTTSQPFFTRFNLGHAEIKDIDLAKPKKPFTFTLKGAFDNYSPLDISGTCSPLADKLLVDTDIKLRNYSLEQVSPYVIDTIGTKFVDGQLFITTKLKIEGDLLNMDNDVVCHEIKAQTVNADAQAALSLPISLDMALSLLRDSRGDIDLNMPVSGHLDDFSVSKTDIILTAFSKAIMVAVTPYLAYTALGPAGAIAAVGLRAGKEIMTSNFPDLVFTVGQTELTSEHKKTLTTIGQELEKKSKVDYFICSKAMVWEEDPTLEKTVENEQLILNNNNKRRKLLGLSRMRAENSRSFLLNNFSLDRDHLLICPPSINYELSGKPTVKFRD